MTSCHGNRSFSSSTLLIWHYHHHLSRVSCLHDASLFPSSIIFGARMPFQFLIILFSLIGTHVQCKNLGFNTQFGFLWFVYVVVDSWIVGLNWSSQCSWVHFLLSSFRSRLWHIHYLDFFFNYAFKMNTLLKSCHFLHGTFHYILCC